MKRSTHFSPPALALHAGYPRHQHLEAEMVVLARRCRWLRS